MLGFSPKLPVTQDDRRWVDEGFQRLEKLLGRRRMLEATVVQPTAEDFPDPYDNSPAATEKLFRRVCEYMKVDRGLVDFEVFADQTEEMRAILPSWHSSNDRHAAGLFTHDAVDGDGSPQRMTISIRSTQLKDPLALVATIAHELGHLCGAEIYVAFASGCA